MKRSAFISFIGVVVFSAVFLGPRWCFAFDEDARKIIVGAIERFKAMQDYTCRLDKRVEKNGVMYEDLGIQVKYKKPARYYFRWSAGISKGREAIFAAGRHEGKIVAHPGGLLRFVTLRLDPEGRLAMRENRHALHHSGLGQIMHLVETNFQRARNIGLNAVQLLGERRVDDRVAWLLQGSFPEDQGFYAKTVLLYIDKKLQLPVKISIHDWSDRLVEEYVFHDLTLNVGLDEEDFDPGNPAYNFR
jgi:outer membrane lipoprotein-sorting protein